jgi:hypothetical protein
MPFRNGFYLGGAVVAVALGLFLICLWQPESQVRKHSTHLFDAVTAKNWTKFETFLGDDYRDQWGNDRGTVSERIRRVFRYADHIRVRAVAPDIRIEGRTVYWRARIVIEEGDNNEIATEIKARVNNLTTPFELEWHRVSRKPWDWKLVVVSNRELALPADY